MRTIRLSNSFKRDFKKHSRGKHRDALDTDLPALTNALANDAPLPDANHDHELTGQFRGLRECHVKPDLLLVYKKEGDDLLILMALGTHSELFG